MGKAVLRLCSLLMMLMCFADMLKGYDRYVTQWDTCHRFDILVMFRNGLNFFELF